MHKFIKQIILFLGSISQNKIYFASSTGIFLAPPFLLRTFFFFSGFSSETFAVSSFFSAVFSVSKALFASSCFFCKLSFLFWTFPFFSLVSTSSAFCFLASFVFCFYLLTRIFKWNDNFESKSTWGASSSAFIARTISCSSESCSSWTKECNSSNLFKSNRKIPIPKELADRIREQGYIYEGSLNQIFCTLDSAQKALGLPHFGIHRLRSYFASKARALGLPDSIILTLGGWKSDNIMKNVYRKALEEDVTKGSKKYLNHFKNV